MSDSALRRYQCCSGKLPPTHALTGEYRCGLFGLGLSGEGNMAVAGHSRRFHYVDHRLVSGIGIGADHHYRIVELARGATHLIGYRVHVTEYHRSAVDGVLPADVDRDVDLVGPLE